MTGNDNKISGDFTAAVSYGVAVCFLVYAYIISDI